MKNFYQILPLLLSCFALTSCLNGNLQWAASRNNSSSGGTNAGVTGGDTGGPTDENGNEEDGDDDSQEEGNGTLYGGGTFGADGKVNYGFTYMNEGTQTEYAERGRAIALHPDGRILVGMSQATFDGDNMSCAVLALNPDGSPDTSFGTLGNGLVRINLINLGNPDCAVTSLAIQGDKILFAGWTSTMSGDHVPLLGRLKSNGAPDPTFGGNPYGFTAFSLSYSADIKAMQVDNADRIWLAASAAPGIDSSAFSVVRYLTDGSPDDAFGTLGKKDFSLAGKSQVNVHSMALTYLTDTHPVVFFSGDLRITGGNPQAFVFSLDGISLQGSPDFKFPGNGQPGLSVYTVFGEAKSIAIQNVSPNVRYLVLTGRRTRFESSADSYLLRVRQDTGIPDSSFGEQDGATLIPPSDNVTTLNTVSVKLLDDGKLLTLAYLDNQSKTVLNRFESGGRPDLSFGLKGSQELGTSEFAAALAIASDAYFIIGTTLLAPTDIYVRRFVP